LLASWKSVLAASAVCATLTVLWLVLLDAPLGRILNPFQPNPALTAYAMFLWIFFVAVWALGWGALAGLLAVARRTFRR
jgi:hypothetical protein